jgi:hypothetical protein
MALDATWKEKKTQKVEEYVKKNKMQDWETLVAPHLKRITWGWQLKQSYCYKVLCHSSLGRIVSRRH